MNTPTWRDFYTFIHPRAFPDVATAYSLMRKRETQCVILFYYQTCCDLIAFRDFVLFISIHLYSLDDNECTEVRSNNICDLTVKN